MPNSFGDFLNTHDPVAEEEKMNRQAVLQGILNDAGQYDPDAYARAMDQAARTGAKPSAVIRNQKLYDEADKRKIQAPPVGTRFSDWLMANPDNTKVSHDDIEIPQKFEALTKALDSYNLTPSQQQAVLADRKRIADYNYSNQWAREASSVLANSASMVAGSLTNVLRRGAELGRAAYQTIAAPTNWATGEGTTPTERAKAQWDKLTKIWQYSSPDSTINQMAGDVMSYYGQGKATGVSQYLVDPKTGQQFLNPDWTTTGGHGVVDKALTAVLNRNMGNALGSVPGGILSFGVAGASAPALFSTEAGLNKFEQARAEGANPLTAGVEGLGSFLLNLGLMTKLPVPTETKTVLGTAGQAVGRATVLGPAMTAGENLLGRLHGNERPIFEGSLESTASMLGFEMGGAIPHMVELASQSKLLKRSPQKFQEAIDHITKDTVAEDIQIAAERFNTYFQEKGIDPVEAAKAIGVKNYTEANATGTDLVIPIGKMLAVLGGTEHLKGLEPDLRFRTGDRTLRELEDYQAEFAKQSEAGLKTQGEAVKSEVATPELQSIQDIMQKRLEAAGDTPSIAETKAQIHAKVITNLAERVGEDPMALMDKYGWTVSRDMPGVVPTGAESRLFQEDLATLTESPTIYEGGTNATLARRETNIGRIAENGGTEPGQHINVSPQSVDQAVASERLSSERIKRRDFALAEPESVKPSTVQESPGPVIGPRKALIQASSTLDDIKAEARAVPIDGSTPDGYRFNSDGNRIAVDGPNGEYLELSVHPHRALVVVDNVLVPEGRRGEGLGKKLYRRAAQVVGNAYPEVRWVIGETASKEADAMRKSYPGTVTEGNAHITPIKEMMEGRSNKETIPVGQTLYQSAHFDDATGLPLNIDGTVTLYHHTSSDNAQKIRDTSKLSSAAEPDVYLTTRAEPDTGYGDTSVAVNVDPRKLKLDDEFPNGRRDYSIGTGKPGGSISVKLPGEGQSLSQGESIKRGYLNISENGKLDIHLLEHANESTVFHEFGHGYLEMMGDLALKESAPKQIQDDYAAILKWLGVESRDQITTAEHEKFARANEAYLLEGKAPSEGLRGAFQRVKYWMMFYYSKLSDLGVKFNPEIRGVFDRLYASDREIEAAKQNLEPKQLFATPEDMGVSKAEFDIYAKTKAKEIATAKEALQVRLIKEFARERDASWKSDLKNMKQQVSEEVDGLPEFRAFKALTDGQMEDGTPVKLNRQSLVDQYGEDVVKALPRRFRHTYALEGGMDADTAAELLGFNSGHEMLKAMSEMPERKQFIADTAEQRMKAIHGDMIQDGTVADAAVEALHNDAKAQALLIELRILRKAEREAKPITDKAKAEQKATQAEGKAIDAAIPPQAAFRDTAQSLVTETPIKDLKPYDYTQAELKASNEAYDLKGKGKFKEAADVKQREILSHFMFLEATKAKERADKIYTDVRRSLKPPTQTALVKAGADYQEQYNNILERYEFAPASNKTIENRKSLSEFIKEQEAKGADFLIDPTILNDARKINYRSISITELEAVHDALKNIETAARRQVEFDLNGKKVTFEDAVSQIDTVARQNNKSKMVPRTGADLGAWEKAGRWILGTDAYMSKMEWSIDQLDGGDINGPARRFIKKRIDDASGAEKALGRLIFDQVRAAVEARGKVERAKELDLTDIQFPQHDRPLTKGQAMSWVLNLGTEENRRVALLGEGLINGDGAMLPQVDQVLGSPSKPGVLSSSDCKFIQAIWDSLAELQPKIKENERRRFGTEPKWKEITPFVVHTSDGETIQMKGGYYPQKADREVSDIGRKQIDLGTPEGSFIRPTTSRSHTKEVTGATYPLLLDYPTVLGEHLGAVIKDVTMGEAISDVSKIIMNPTVSKAIGETLGPKHEGEFLPWLQAVAGQVKEESKNPFIRMLMSRRTGMVTARLAGNLSSYLVQGADTAKLIADHEFKFGLPGMERGELSQAHWDIRRNPKEMIKWIREMSPNEMAFREENFNREIRELFNVQTGLEAHKSAVTKYLMQGFAVMDNLQTFPAWLAQYRQGMKVHGNSEQAVMEADRLIARAFQAGEARNMSRMMREPGLVKLFTTFGGDANTWYGLLSSSIHSGSVQRASVAIMALVFEQVLSQALRGRLPQKDEDWGSWTTQQALSALFNPFGPFGDAADYAVKKLTGQFASFSNPTSQAIEKGLKLPGNLQSENKDTEEKAIDTVDAVGTWTGAPATGQIVKSWKYIHQWRTGDVQPEGFLDVAKGLAFGPPPKPKK